jgi:hemerythrin
MDKFRENGDILVEILQGKSYQFSEKSTPSESENTEKKDDEEEAKKKKKEDRKKEFAEYMEEHEKSKEERYMTKQEFAEYSKKQEEHHKAVTELSEKIDKIVKTKE